MKKCVKKNMPLRLIPTRESYGFFLSRETRDTLPGMYKQELNGAKVGILIDSGKVLRKKN
jgi:hypothetical protein